MRSHFRTLAVLAAATVSVATLVASGSAQGTTLVVDDDRAQCRNAQFTTAAGIQLAENAARPGDTIKVCPGAYTPVVVDTPQLTFIGSTKALNQNACLSTTNTAASPASNSVVNGGAGAPAWSVQAYRVTIKNFTIQNSVNAPGVYLARNWSGYNVLENVIQRNTFGVYLNSNGRYLSRVDENCVRENTVAGSAAGNGVYSDQGVRRATVNENTFTRHTNASVILVGGGGGISQWHVDIDVNENAIIRDAAVIAANTVRGEFSENYSQNSNSSGIFFGGNVSDTDVSKNRIVDCAFTGINMRFLPGPGAYDVTQPNFNNRVKGNHVQRCGDWGIGVRDGSSYNTVSGNSVEDSGIDGVVLQSAVGNNVLANRSLRNRSDGIEADAGSRDNLIERNFMRSNAEHDCHDDSTGTGTAGTANFWVENDGRTENRPGLCPGDRDDDDGGDDDDEDGDDDDEDDDEDDD